MKSFVFASLLVVGASAFAQETVFSGPQPGEGIKPFKAYAVTGAESGKEVQALADAMEGPATVVFIHNLERSLLPLVRTVDQYGGMRKGAMKTVVVFLGDDRLALENQLPLVSRSVQFQSPMLLSLEGAEGPGSYGLNKQCLVTIIVADKGKVTANFALVQPGIADAPKVIAAMAAASGDPKPPTVDELQSQSGRNAPNAGMRGGAMSRPLDLNSLDTSTPEAMKKAIDALIAEVQRLRAENAALKGAQPQRPNAGGGATLPGAAPTDATLLSLLRQFIQPTNKDADVDAALKGMEERMKGDAGLTKQAVDGVVRVVHLKYGTEYAQKAGQAFVDKYKK